MKNIELTEDHKIKLLEMCNFLFPEYKFTLEQDCQLGAHSYSFNNLVFSKLTEKNHLLNGIEIHWFEFCITWLSHKIIFNPNNKLFACNHNHASLLESTMSIFYGEKHGIHPVDYLYKRFKK
jgi:hypothetical protein